MPVKIESVSSSHVETYRVVISSFSAGLQSAEPCCLLCTALIHLLAMLSVKAAPETCQ